jgi:hypothetical protein
MRDRVGDPAKEKHALLCGNARFLAASAFAGWLPPTLKLRRDKTARQAGGRKSEVSNQMSEVSGQRSEGVFERRKPGRRTEESAFALVIG